MNRRAGKNLRFVLVLLSAVAVTSCGNKDSATIEAAPSAISTTASTQQAPAAPPQFPDAWKLPLIR